MKTKKSKRLTLDQFKDKHYGKKGTAKRDKLEAGYENFKIGALRNQWLHPPNSHSAPP